MTAYYKATRLDGTDFWSGEIDYGAALDSGDLVELQRRGDGDLGFPGPSWLHVATLPTACVGMSWPCRLFVVEPVGDVHRAAMHPYKVGCRAVRVVEEGRAHEALGPQGRQVAALIERAARITGDEARALDAALDAARAAARAAALDAAWAAARAAALDAAGALVVADLAGGQHGLTQNHIDLLLGPWRAVIGDPLAVGAAS